MKCHRRSESGPVESRRSRIAAKIQRCRLVQRLLRRAPPKEACAGCLETMPANELVDLPCQHKYCDRCIREMAVTGIADEQFFPPRCCSRKVPSEIILPMLPPKERELFMSKANEYATPIADRWYCPVPTCGRWIPPNAVKGEKSQTQACPYCGTGICSGCRGISHNSGDCSDTGLSAVLEVARLQRWQRCFNCGAVVELIFGCDHITCRCRAQFCYKCGEPWSSCVCVTPAERPMDFFTFVIDGKALNRDEEAGLTAVLAAMLCHEMESEEDLNEKGRKENQPKVVGQKDT
ncbi:hypothetical protein BDV28DRAFT_33691 [Aspergillus coremiiformis]|uniref:RBR-type E3 ubiquitin transferase n=1 Tax=Aspergillus coremiiformis TaxID=138285 RepID=A0A5N6YZX3_9EURO|nr:hypothetical protein BDV28DRAFT_33691 [Aspergillus coremiiformis]